MSKLQLKYVAVSLLVLSASAILWTRLRPRLEIIVPPPPPVAETSSSTVQQGVVVKVDIPLHNEFEFIAQNVGDSIESHIETALDRAPDTRDGKKARIRKISGLDLEMDTPEIGSNPEGALEIRQPFEYTADVYRNTNLLGRIFGMGHCELQTDGEMVIRVDPRTSVTPDWTFYPRIDVDPKIHSSKCADLFIAFDIKRTGADQATYDREARKAAGVIGQRLRAELPPIKAAVERVWQETASLSLSDLGSSMGETIDIEWEPCRFQAAYPVIIDTVLSVSVGLQARSRAVVLGAEQPLGSTSMCDAGGVGMGDLPPLMISDLPPDYDLRVPFPVGWRTIEDRFRASIQERVRGLTKHDRRGRRGAENGGWRGFEIEDVKVYPSGQNVVATLHYGLRQPRVAGTLHVVTKPTLDADSWAIRFEEAQYTPESREVIQRIFDDEGAIGLKLLLLAIEGSSLDLEGQVGAREEVLEIARELTGNAIAVVEEDWEPEQVMEELGDVGRLRSTGGQASRVADIGLENMDMLTDALIVWFGVTGSLEFTLQ